MVRIVKVNNEEFKCRPLKRKEVKALRAAGHEPFNFDGEEILRGTMDAVLDLVFAGDDRVDDLDYMDAAKVFHGVLSATMGTEEEVKNS